MESGTMAIGVGLLGLGTVGAGVAAILMGPEGRHPLVGELALQRIAVRDLERPRPLELDPQLLTTSPEAVIDDPAVEIVVDRSSSMLAMDFQKDGRRADRLTALKDVAGRFVLGGEGLNGRPGDLVANPRNVLFGAVVCYTRFVLPRWSLSDLGMFG